jgi:hypothetical protein
MLKDSHTIDSAIERPAIVRQRLQLVLHAHLPCAWLQVCGVVIKAHKLILTTQCDYFKKMLAPDQFEEGATNTVKVCMLGRVANLLLLLSQYLCKLLQAHIFMICRGLETE